MRIPRFCIYLLAAATAWVPSSHAVAAGDLLTDSCNSHQATIESIRTFHCRVSFSFERPQPWGNTMTGEYWRIGSTFRCKSNRGSAVTDSSNRDGVTTSFTVDSKQSGDKGRDGHITNKDMPYLCDAWSYGLLSLFGGDRFRVSLKELIGSAGATSSARHAEKENRRMVRIEISTSRADLEVWLDPSVNYLVRHLKGTMKGAVKLEGEFTVESFQEVNPGVFFPAKVTYTGFKGKDREKTGWVAVFSGIEINQPLADKALDIRFPPGLLVHDDIRNGVFRTNAAGAAVLPALSEKGQRIELVSNPAVPTSARESADDKPLRVTEEESQPRSRWILPVAIVLLLLGCALGVVRRNRARRAAAAAP